MNCAKCGNLMADTDNNCASCGAPAQQQPPAPPMQQQQPPQQQWQQPQQPPVAPMQQPPQQQWQQPQQQQQPPQQQWQQGQPQQQQQQQWQQGQQGASMGEGFKVPAAIANKSVTFWLNVAAPVLILIFMMFNWFKIGAMGVSQGFSFFSIMGSIGDLAELGAGTMIFLILYLIAWLAAAGLLVFYIIKLFTNYRNAAQKNLQLALLGFICAAAAAVLVQVAVFFVAAYMKDQLGSYGSGLSGMVGNLASGSFPLYAALAIALFGIFYCVPALKKEIMSGR